LLQFSYHGEPGDWQPRADRRRQDPGDYLTSYLTLFDEAS
jgi:hypothetical protein